MPILLPYILHGEKATAIIEQEVGAMMKRLPENAERVYPDLVLPGMKHLPARQRFARYIFLISRVDLPLLRDPDYLSKREQGLAPNPVSPFLANLLATPDVYREVRRDFLSLLDDYLEKAGQSSS